MGSHATRGLTWRASSRSKDVYECKTKFSPFFVVVRIILVVISHEEDKEGLSRLISIAIAAFEDIQRRGQGVAVVDGNIVENLHAEGARQLLKKAKTIAQLNME